MTPLRNPRHERFAQLLAEGRSQADAFKELYPNSRRWQADSVHEKASKLAAKVRPRLQEFQRAAAERAVMTKEKYVNYLASVMLTPVGKVDAESILAQEVEDRVTGETVIRRVKMASKMTAADLLAKALGFYEPEKRDQTFSFPGREEGLAHLSEALEKVKAGCRRTVSENSGQQVAERTQ